MVVKSLSNTAFDTIVDCFLKAFENYFVKMPLEKDYYRKRWTAAKVDFNLSYGMFDGNKLVGFIIHAVDNRQGIRTAFNTGTGVIPEYRGRGIVRMMYDFALDDLKKHGIERSQLEVITENAIAIHAYQKIGFEITRQYSCFSGIINCSSVLKPEVHEIAMNELNWDELPNQDGYSWDHQKETLLGGPYHYFEVHFKGNREAYFIIDPERNYLAQLDVFKNDPHVWERLFKAIQQVSETIRIINVDETQETKIQQLKAHGLKITVKQYEMVLDEIF
ncbi:hypothetical protein GCM10022260_20530 [Gaetbulibacter aestuarii]|uniref:GNAT family N-acetyltransferase n=2 Tax=Gaetbulibacter aestuarii TaxID=1502358 RepID=A0ABW7MYW2_9FLAO